MNIHICKLQPPATCEFKAAHHETNICMPMCSPGSISRTEINAIKECPYKVIAHASTPTNNPSNNE